MNRISFKRKEILDRNRTTSEDLIGGIQLYLIQPTQRLNCGLGNIPSMLQQIKPSLPDKAYFPATCF